MSLADIPKSTKSIRWMKVPTGSKGVKAYWYPPPSKREQKTHFTFVRARGQWYQKDPMRVVSYGQNATVSFDDAQADPLSQVLSSSIPQHFAFI